jgi:glycosyltransferase involved in cell wall biosynthesis
MKILHVVSYFPPDRLGGVGTAVAHLHRGLLARGHQSVVLTSGVSHDDPTVIRFGRSPISFLSRVALKASMARDFDVVQVHHGEPIGLLLAMKLWRIRVPVVGTYHVGFVGMAAAARPYRLEGRVFSQGPRAWFFRSVNAPVHRLLDVVSLKLIDAPVFIARSSARDVLGEKRAESARVIHYGLEPARPQPDSPPPEPAELLFVGVGSHRKRICALPFILRHVRRSIPTARLRVIGFHLHEHPEAMSLIREFGLEGAILCEGKLRPDQIGPFHRASQVLVMPSAYEGLPMAILEAMQSGLPCVATRVSGHPEAIRDGINGYLVDLDDPVQMAQRCVAILKDPALRDRMSQAARQTIQDGFTSDRQLDAYLEVYTRLAASSRG